MYARGPRHRRPAVLALVAGLVAGLAVIASGAQADPNSLREDAVQLESENARLDAEAAAALLELYALESELRGAERRAASLRAQIAELEEREASARLQATVARTSQQAAQDALASRVKALYIEGSPDPIEVVLGAASLDELVDAIDSVNRVADHDERIIEEVQAARSALRTALAELEERQAELRQLVADAEQASAKIEAARDGKATYIASLRGRQELNSAEIASLLSQAVEAEQKALELTAEVDPVAEEQVSTDTAEAAPETSPIPSATDVSDEPGRQVTVSSTMYCLQGTTATGVYVAHGVIAVDPAYIPLGTRMFVPGYGEGVAADTGGAVIGWTIDMWVEDCARADAWGRRSITITIYD